MSAITVRGGLFGGVMLLTIPALLVPMVKAKYPGYQLKGYDITATNLKPVYPDHYDCSPLTSLYASWIDVDGTEREEQHSGVDGGREGEPVLAPAPGEVKAVWQANWGWGREGALLIKHRREDLNLDDGPPFYYSAFYHLDFASISHLRPGQPIVRGEVLTHVFRPGGRTEYLPEVHWEVWEVLHDDRMEWTINEYGGLAWRSRGARLIDPLYMLSLDRGISGDGTVEIQPFVAGRDYSQFRGFTYILPCVRKQTALHRPRAKSTHPR